MWRDKKMKETKERKKIVWIIILLVGMFLVPTIAQANSDVIVLLDPGHGGYDGGASAGGLVEKNVTWKIATRVKQILDNTPGITGVLSRAENECPEIYQRGEMAKSIRSRFGC